MIVTEAVQSYLARLRPEPDGVLGEMERHAARDRIPIVVPQTGQLLEVLVAARRPRRVVEVGTAIGVSTLYMARALPAEARIVSFDIDEERQAAARHYLQQAGVLDRVELRLQDARAGLGELTGDFDFAFVDGVKAEYGDYLDRLLPLLAPGAVLAIDNALMRGTVAEGHDEEGRATERIATARAVNERVLHDGRFLGTLTPVGDGVLVAVATPETPR